MILKKEIEDFEVNIKFNFKNKNNLLKALIHPSYVKNKQYKKNKIDNQFERFEFLGDRVLGIVIADLIFAKFINLNEGDLSKKLSYLVQKEFLYKVALQISIDKILRFSNKKQNFTKNKSILADSVEALIGGIFLDGGYSDSLKFIKNIWGPYLDIEASNQQDPKTKLQEISQLRKKTLPNYTLIKKEGPSHLPLFTVTLKVLNLKLITAKGKSKQDAEKQAAIKALEELND